MDYQQIREQTEEAISQVFEQTPLLEGDIFVVGCSSSEIDGGRIGKASNKKLAEAVFDAIYGILKERKIFLAAQCCEHLNRSLIIERAALELGQEIVNAVPQLHAGGSFAMTAYENFEEPVAVERIRATAGMDIGATLIGMHLKGVAVPLRIERKNIGEAGLICARTRPKFVGGERAVYDGELAVGNWMKK